MTSLVIICQQNACYSLINKLQRISGSGGVWWAFTGWPATNNGAPPNQEDFRNYLE